MIIIKIIPIKRMKSDHHINSTWFYVYIRYPIFFLFSLKPSSKITCFLNLQINNIAGMKKSMSAHGDQLVLMSLICSNNSFACSTSFVSVCSCQKQSPRGIL